MAWSASASCSPAGRCISCGAAPAERHRASSRLMRLAPPADDAGVLFCQEPRRGRMRGPILVLCCAAAGCGATVARAELPPTPRAVVERYVVATGGRQALAADTLLHVRGHQTSAGMTGTFEQW